jgi:hypothetical protein
MEDHFAQVAGMTPARSPKASLRQWLQRGLLLAALAGITRCGATSPKPPNPQPAIPTAEVGGLWAGTAVVTPCALAVDRCNSFNNVTFTLTQSGSQLIGRYTCAAGNMSCRQGGADSSGTILAGSVSGNRINLAVKVPADMSNCYFAGSTTGANQANGVYMCYQHGNIIEEGVWNLARQMPEE